MSTGQNMRRGKLPLVLGLVSAMAVAGLAEAGKPSSGGTLPLVVTATAGYTQTALFGTPQALTAVHSTDEAAMSGVDDVILWNGIEVDEDGGVYVLYRATDEDDSVQPSDASAPFARERFTGIIRHDTGGTSVMLAGSLEYDGSSADPFSVESYSGEEIVAMDRVPSLLSGASGPLAAGDLVALRWADRDTANGVDRDDVVEVVHLRPLDTNGSISLSEIGVLHAFPVPGADEDWARFNSGSVAAGPLGQVYVSLVDETLNADGSFDVRLWKLSDDGGWSNPEDVEPPFAIEQPIEVDDAGDLYVRRDDFGADTGGIFRLPEGGSPATDYTWHASFNQGTAADSFQRWSHDGGSFAIALQKPPTSKRSTWNANFFVGLVNAGETTVHADRIADTADSAVGGLTASEDGEIYVLHADRSYDSAANRYDVLGYTVYRLDPPSDGGGGDTGGGGGGGNGGGKGKNK